MHACHFELLGWQQFLQRFWWCPSLHLAISFCFGLATLFGVSLQLVAKQDSPTEVKDQDWGKLKAHLKSDAVCPSALYIIHSALYSWDGEKKVENSPSGWTLFLQLSAPGHVNVFSLLTLFHKWLSPSYAILMCVVVYNILILNCFLMKHTSVQLCFPSSTITGNLKSSLVFDSTLQKDKSQEKYNHFSFPKKKGWSWRNLSANAV